MNTEELHFRIKRYDIEQISLEKRWNDIRNLKPDEMDELEFQRKIQQARLDNKLIDYFQNNNALECKRAIYQGANKEYLYKYVSQFPSEKLSMIQHWLLEDLHNTKKEKNFPYTYDRKISDPKLIQKEDFEKLLKKFEKNEEFSSDEKDYYLLKEDEFYIAIDNTTGEMYVEEFKSKEKAEKYLQGESLDKLRDEECIYEVCIYETIEDYEQGEPFQLDVFSNLDEAKDELEKAVNYNQFFSGKIINQDNGKEEYSFYLNTENERYEFVFECVLESDNKKYEHQYLLAKNPNDLNEESSIDLNGDFYFNCNYKIQNPRLIRKISDIHELLEFCNDYSIRLPKGCIKEDGFIAGGPNGLLINNQLNPVDWIENLQRDAECL